MPDFPWDGISRHNLVALLRDKEAEVEQLLITVAKLALPLEVLHKVYDGSTLISQDMQHDISEAVALARDTIRVASSRKDER
jgi:hypothetical protein